MTMRLIEPNEVFDDPLAMEVPTNRGDVFCEIAGLPIMYNVFQRLPFYTNSIFYCNGDPSDQRAEAISVSDRFIVLQAHAPPMFAFARIKGAPVDAVVVHKEENTSSVVLILDNFSEDYINAALSRTPGQCKLRLTALCEMNPGDVVYRSTSNLELLQSCAKQKSQPRK